MTLGLLILRVVAGVTMAGHGSQKLFGWFGGPGRAGTRGMTEQLGFRSPGAMAVLAGLSEFLGGIGFALGLLTPFAAIAITIVMLNAIFTVHLTKGFWNTNGGLEYPLVIAAVAVAVSAIGPGNASLDAAFGIDGSLSGNWWAVIVALAAVVVSTATITAGRHGHEMPGHPAH